MHHDSALFDHLLTGIYREVRPPERLVHTWRWEAEREMGEALVTGEFPEVEDLTEVVLTHEFFRTENARDDHNRGWSGCFDRRARILQGNTEPHQSLRRGGHGQDDSA